MLDAFKPDPLSSEHHMEQSCTISDLLWRAGKNGRPSMSYAKTGFRNQRRENRTNSS